MTTTATKRMSRSVPLFLCVAVWLSCPSSAFIHPRRRQNVFDASSPESHPHSDRDVLGTKNNNRSSFLRVTRYGPPESSSTSSSPSSPDYRVNFNSSDDDGDDSSSDEQQQEEWERADAARVARQKVQFHDLVQQVLQIQDPAHLPSLLTKHVELVLSMRGYEGADLIANALREARAQGGEELEQATMDAVECILSFAEEFVDQAQHVDGANKKLLGKIIRTMTNRDEKRSTRDQEELLDELMKAEKANFTPGFLKHVEGECDRIASAPVMTRESSRLLEIMRLIQARVLEELGKDIGEGAIVLGHLLGYDNTKERLAVLDAGLTVRGVGFAHEMAALTEEALDGFQRVPGGADPELVERVSGIQTRIQHFIGHKGARP